MVAAEPQHPEKRAVRHPKDIGKNWLRLTNTNRALRCSISQLKIQHDKFENKKHSQ
jgi:hypothetical protein